MQEIEEMVRGFESEEVSFLQDIVRTKSVNPAFGGDGDKGKEEGKYGEKRKAELVARKMHELGYEEVQILADPKAEDRLNVIGTIKGKSSKGRLVYLAHSDTVPEGDIPSWKDDPYSGVIREGKVFGRGSIDDGIGIASAVYAGAAVKQLKEKGIAPEKDVMVVVGADEENGSEYGAKFLLDQGIFRKEDEVVIVEAMDGKIQVGEKGILWQKIEIEGAEEKEEKQAYAEVKIDIEGKQGHASMPQVSINATEVMAEIVRGSGRDGLRYTEIEPPNTSVNTIPGKVSLHARCYSSESLERLEGACRDVEKESGAKIKLQACGRKAEGSYSNTAEILAEVVSEGKRAMSEKFQDRDAKYEPDITTSTYTKIEQVDRLRKNLYVDCRYLPSRSEKELVETLEEVNRKVSEKYGAKISMSTVNRDPPAATDEGSALVKKLRETVKERLGYEPRLVGIGGGTDAKAFRLRGMDAVVYALGAEDMCHASNEYAGINDMMDTTRALVSLPYRSK